MSSQTMVYPSFLGILLVTIIVIALIFAVLWKKGKTVEAMLVLNALLQIVIILILVFKF
jgi:amino acid permease